MKNFLRLKTIENETRRRDETKRDSGQREREREREGERGEKKKKKKKKRKRKGRSVGGEPEWDAHRPGLHKKFGKVVTPPHRRHRHLCACGLSKGKTPKKLEPEK